MAFQNLIRQMPVTSTLAPIPGSPAPPVVTDPQTGRRIIIDPNTITDQRAYGDLLLKESGDPAVNWAQGLGNMTKALVGGLAGRRADATEAANQDALNAGITAGANTYVKLLNGGTMSPQEETAFFGNPAIDKETKASVAALLGKPAADYGFMDVNGQVVRTNKTAGTAEPIYKAPDILSDEALKQKLELAGAGASKITLGPNGPPLPPPTPGYAYKMNPDGTAAVDPATGGPTLVPIAGGPAAAALAAADKADAIKRQRQLLQADVVVQDIGRALDILNTNPGGSSGAIGAGLSIIPATNANTLDSFYQTIRSNITMDKLQATRDAAANGASGLGQVTTFEEKMLGSLLGEIKVSQDPSIQKYNLARFMNAYYDVIYGPGQGPARIDLQALPTAPSSATPGTESFKGTTHPAQPSAPPATPGVEHWEKSSDGQWKRVQ